MLFKILIVSVAIYILSKKFFPNKKSQSKFKQKDDDIVDADYKVVDED